MIFLIRDELKIFGVKRHHACNLLSEFREREVVKANVVNINIWGLWERGIWEFFLLFSYNFSESQKLFQNKNGF